MWCLQRLWLSILQRRLGRTRRCWHGPPKSLNSRSYQPSKIHRLCFRLGNRENNCHENKYRRYQTFIPKRYQVLRTILKAKKAILKNMTKRAWQQKFEFTPKLVASVGLSEAEYSIRNQNLSFGRTFFQNSERTKFNKS